MSEIRFDVAGIPAPQGSKNRGRNGGMFESSKAVGPWREAVRAAARQHVSEMLTGPVSVTLVFRIRRPAGHYRTGKNAHLLRDTAPGWPAAYPDLDKLCRAVLDGLTEGGAWKDDGQAVELIALKRYVHRNVPRGCSIQLSDMEGEPS